MTELTEKEKSLLMQYQSYELFLDVVGNLGGEISLQGARVISTEQMSLAQVHVFV